MTMHEKQPTENESLVDLIELVLGRMVSDEQRQELQARLLASVENRKVYLHRLNLHSALRRQFAFDAEAESLGRQAPPHDERPAGTGRRSWAVRPARWRWVAAAATAAAVLIGVVYLQLPDGERPIAKVTGLSGSLQWTGARGRVLDELAVGEELPGGTIEGMTPGSWFELEFADGSTVTLSGSSMLTFSDEGQKKLHLKRGNVSGNVRPQPAGKPMLIYTRSARLEVLGTRFEVEAGLSATLLNVSEGKVRVRRLSDGSTVDVPARHRVVAGADRKLLPVPVPDSVNRWISRLHLGPDGAQGKWLPRTDTEDAALRAIPYTSPEGKTIYTASIVPSHGDRPAVVARAGSRLRVRGRIASARPVYFGVTVRRPGGEFAGRFQTIRPAGDFQDGQSFEVVLALRDFQLDPSLRLIRSRLPSVPFDLDVDAFWCHTLGERAGLEITEVELLPPSGSAGPASRPTARPQPPVTDIWIAASQGNLRAAGRLLDAGADVNATYTAAGIPGSGATPLHIAVLCDQGEMAALLIERGADLNAKAKDKHGGTPLHWAAALGRLEMAGRLIAAGAEVNAPDNNGCRPLDAIHYDPETRKTVKRKIADLIRAKGGKGKAEHRALEKDGKEAPPSSP